MNEWQMDLRPRNRMAAATLPPALIEETAWDILLALHLDQGCKLSLEKLASVVSAPRPVLNHWLALLEQRQLIVGATHGVSQEIRAMLTAGGRELLEGYLSATSSLQVGARH